jgi:hypothetical protein
MKRPPEAFAWVKRPQMIRESQTRVRKGRAIAVTVFVLLASVASARTEQARQQQAAFAPSAAEAVSAHGAQPVRAAANAQRRAASSARGGQRKSVEFSHATAAHGRACDSCHKFPSDNWKQARAGGEPFPDITQYPTHASCIACHRKQFFSNEKPAPSICSICHESAVPRSISLHPFPTLAEAFDKSPKAAQASSDFLIFFPHDKHLAILGEMQREAEEERGMGFMRASFGVGAARTPASAQEDAAKANEVCATCHQTYLPQGDSDMEFVTPPPKDLAEGAFWLKKGTFKTSPAGHASCFTCHSADAGLSPAPADCASCHKFAPAGQAAPPADFDSQLAARMGITDRRLLAHWRDRQSAPFRHEWFSHAEMKCTDCHQVGEMNTADPRTKRVAVLSCGGTGTGCHITATDDDGGALNLAVAQKRADAAFACTKCHVVLGASSLPAAHASALSAIKK